MPSVSEPQSALAEAVARVGDRWTLLLIEALLEGPLRFGELGEAVAGIAPNILSDRLRRLEGGGLVLARPYSERPRRLAYELTEPGRELAGALRLLAGWGAQHAGGDAPRHEACGSPLDTRWWCETCGRVVDEDESPDVHVV